MRIFSLFLIIFCVHFVSVSTLTASIRDSQLRMTIANARDDIPADLHRPHATLYRFESIRPNDILSRDNSLTTIAPTTLDSEVTTSTVKQLVIFEVKYLDVPSDAGPAARFAWWLQTTANPSDLSNDGVKTGERENHELDIEWTYARLGFKRMEGEQRYFMDGSWLDMGAQPHPIYTAADGSQYFLKGGRVVN